MSGSEAKGKKGQFQRGVSGNPAGRRAGSRSKVLIALDALGEGEAEAIVTAIIDKAKQGDAIAARTILERVWPARKGARLTFDLPAVTKAEDLPGAIAAVTLQVADGSISPDEGTAIIGMLESQRKAIETNEVVARLIALEEKVSRK
jgi:hypothetical protein